MKRIVLALLLVLSLTGMSYAVPLPVGPATFHMTNWENRVTSVDSTLSGIFSLDQLLDVNSQTVWNSGQGGEYLHGQFGGLTLSAINDFGPAGESTGDQYLFKGGWLKVYRSNTALDPTSIASATTGSLWLDLLFVTGTDPTAPGYTLVSALTGVGNDPENVLSIKGSGNSLFDVIGGEAAAAFNTNTYQRYDGSGLFADAAMTNSFYIRNATDINPLLNHKKDGWDVWSKDPIGVNVVPEPATMLLFGLGAAGMAAIRRKKAVA